MTVNPKINDESTCQCGCHDDPARPYRKRVVSDLEVRKAAAKTAVAASKKTGRPVPDWIRELAESP